MADPIPTGEPVTGGPGQLGLRPPVPDRRPTVLRAHGDERVDDWYWLRDRDDPSVLEHLRAENTYTEAMTARLDPLRRSLFSEMVARIAETDLSVPVRRGGWWYYTRTEEGRDYGIHCRSRAEAGEDPPLDPGPERGEQVLLDENELAEGLGFFEVGNLAVSPDHAWLAYATDTTGGELFDLTFRRIDGVDGSSTAEVVPDTYYGLAWANDNATVFYTRVDDAMRPHRVWRHRLGTDPSDDVLILTEPDERFTVSVGWTKDRAFIVLTVASNTTSEVWIVPAENPEARPRIVEPRRAGIEYGIEHHGPTTTIVILTNDGAPDFKVVAAPDETPGRDHWREVLTHRPAIRVEDVDVFDGWLVTAERIDGEASLRVVPLPRSGDADDPFGDEPLDRSWLVPSPEHPATTGEGPNPDPAGSLLRYEQTSLVAPPAVFELDLATRTTALRKRQPVLGGYDPSHYRTFRTWAVADDGVEVPMSIVHRADLLADPDAPGGRPPAVPAPCVLYGYGAYEHSVDPRFSSLRLSLLDRGFVFAIAHVRGGGELGRRWYEDGKMAAKSHTFSDFIACARRLIAEGFTAPDRLAVRGGSAGGLLVGAVLNEAPQLFRAAVAEVPFVDCLTTMMDDTLPLTVGEWEEWGNPVTDLDAYLRMRAYSPYDNVTGMDGNGSPVRYPAVLATAGLHDPRVGYWEPAKWVARLRAADPAARVLLRTELSAGHAGPSGRYDAWREEAFVCAFLIDSLVPGPIRSQERA